MRRTVSIAGNALASLSMVAAFWLAAGSATELAAAGELTLTIANGGKVARVAAIARWVADGNARREVDQKATIDAPAADADAARVRDGVWRFDSLPAGRYDLVLFLEPRCRIEGFSFVPVNEFDPWIAADAQPPAEAAEFIRGDIAGARHFENRVEPLYLAGDDQQVRVLMQLIRDLPTSYKKGTGTVRHEVWQYSWKYGGWVKEKRTRVLDRVLLEVAEMRRWTWLWEPKLGTIEVGDKPVTLEYRLPDDLAKSLQGLRRAGE